MGPFDLVNSLASSRYLPLRLPSTSLNPVALLLGCERLSTSPMPTGLPTLMKRIGIVDVRRFAATEAVEPTGINSLAPRWITPFTAWGASGSLLIHSTSSTTSRFSTTPTSLRPCLNASTSPRSYVLDGEPSGRNPIRTGALGCASMAGNAARRLRVRTPASTIRGTGTSVVGMAGGSLTDDGGSQESAAIARRGYAERGLTRRC